MKAVILAGGLGSRLKNLVKDVPKPMAYILGKPFLEHQIRMLKDQGIDDIILAVYHMADKIKSYFGTGHRWGVDITYSEEEIPLGTAGAIKKAQKYISDTFFVLNGDTYSQIDFSNFMNFHKYKNSSFTISLAKVSDSINYGTVKLESDRIIEFNEKGDGKTNLINRGVYVFNPEIFEYIEMDKNTSFSVGL